MIKTKIDDLPELEKKLLLKYIVNGGKSTGGGQTISIFANYLPEIHVDKIREALSSLVKHNYLTTYKAGVHDAFCFTDDGHFEAYNFFKNTGEFKASRINRSVQTLLPELPSEDEQSRSVTFGEYALWWLAGVLVSARIFVAYLSFPFGNKDISVLFESYYFELLLGVLLVIFPYVFFQVFGISPLQAIKKMRADEKKQAVVVHGSGNIVNFANEDQNSRKHDVLENEDNEKQDVAETSTTTSATQLLIQSINKAELNANRIYSRAGVYLLFGVLIAFGGIVYFSTQREWAPDKADIFAMLLILAPRFGILLFIEFIAFFFLKQYRAAMDEFRHYDTIKRNRESQLAIFLMATNDFPEKNFNAVVEKINFFEQAGKLSSGETTELLEFSKLNKNELELLKELITDLVKLRENAEKSKNK